MKCGCMRSSPKAEPVTVDTCPLFSRYIKGHRHCGSFPLHLIFRNNDPHREMHKKRHPVRRNAKPLIGSLTQWSFFFLRVNSFTISMVGSSVDVSAAIAVLCVMALVPLVNCPCSFSQAFPISTAPPYSPVSSLSWQSLCLVH